MKAEFENIVHQACRVLLRPIASMLLRAGVTWREFCELGKTAFIEAATEEYGINGRPTNISRVSILTGISRKEVKRQRDLLASEQPPAPQKTTDATRVLSGWFQDPDFVQASGQPLPLPEKGSDVSFEALCQRYAGGMATPTLLKELLNTQTVVRNDSGDLYPQRRYYQPAQHDDENLLWAVNLIRDLTQTMNNNVFKDEHTQLRFGGKADNLDIPLSNAAAFHAFLDIQGQAFLEQVDDWLTEHVSPDSNEARVRLGVGLFGIESASTQEQST
ncbi:MAG: DUF6502 family protein [Gammaproteobacteria bacterium]